jgi:hypothetical protein
MATTGINTQPAQRSQRAIRFGAPTARSAPVARATNEKVASREPVESEAARQAPGNQAEDVSLTQLFMSLAGPDQAAGATQAPARPADAGVNQGATDLKGPDSSSRFLDAELAADFEGLAEMSPGPGDDANNANGKQAARPVATTPVVAAPVKPAPAVKMSRAERFAPRGEPDANPAGVDAASPASSAVASERDIAFTQIQVASLQSIRAHGAQTVADAKKSMAAAKVLTPLVASISFNPGFGGSQADRTQALTGLLKEVHVTAEQTANKISEVCGRDVPQWMVTGLMQALSEAVATQWQRTGKLESNLLGESMKIVFGDASNLAHLIENASQAAYHEVKTIDHARDRVTVSTVSAAWRVYDWVTHQQLAVDPRGDSPSVFFTYGLEPMELVNKILTRCVDEARAFLLDVGDPDLRVAHLQASIGRMTALVGAEYVTQTRNVMTWIANAPTPQGQEERAAMAQAQLETRILPHVFEWARQNFIRIEEGALSAMEVFDEQKNSPKITPNRGTDGAHSRGGDDAQHGQ